MTGSDPIVDCVLQIRESGETETVMFTCTEAEYALLMWLAERIPDRLTLTKRVNDGPAN